MKYYTFYNSINPHIYHVVVAVVSSWDLGIPLKSIDVIVVSKYAYFLFVFVVFDILFVCCFRPSVGRWFCFVTVQR